MRKLGKELRAGDILVDLWFKPKRDRIAKIIPYSGPYAFICGIAKFEVSGVEMSLEAENVYEVAA